MATLAEVLRGYQPPTTSALADPIKEHFRTLPQQFNANQAEQMAMLARAFPDNTLKNADPKAMAEMAMQVPFNALTAFHGTPHKIKGLFDISKVGTGEGNQSYGHGMYFAESPNIAKHYQQALGKWIDRVKIGEMELPVYEAMVKYADEGVSAAKVLERMKNKGQLSIDQYNSMIKDVVIPEIRTNAKIPQEKWGDVEGLAGNLYKVDIPDEHIPNMLNWDEKVPEDLRKRISAKTMEQFGNGATGTSGEHLYKEIVFEMRRNGSKAPEVDASKWLHDNGITGIRYKDAMSRGTDEGTSNFVVFDPSTVKILEENSIPTRKELIQQQIDKIE